MIPGNVVVDHACFHANSCYLVDFIEYCFTVQHLNFDQIRHLYLKEAQSAAQIARKFGVAKSVIIGVVKRLGIGAGTSAGRMTNPNNFRHHNPPYGFKVIDNKLVPNKSELRFCRLVVELIDRKGFSARATARELESRKIKNRRGQTKWGHLVIQEIYKRWKGKF